MALGIGYNEFWDLTPRIVLFCIEAKNKERKSQLDYDNYLAFLQGAYFCDALCATVGNMFSGKGSKKAEYPSKPYDLNNEYEEQELDKQRQAFWDSLMIAKINFDAQKGSS